MRIIPMSNKSIFYILLSLSAFVVLFILLKSDNTFDTGDGIQHYLMAKYCWKHPELLLDLWGKPIFTLLSSPFAQFGLKGMIFFQMIFAFLASIYAFKITDQFNYSLNSVIPIFIFFSPIYFAVINSGLTEILFSFFLVLTYYLYIQKKYILGTIIFSFAIFVRPESYFIIPIIAIYLLLRKKYKYIPLLATGFFIFSIIGYFHFNDIFWIIHNNYQVSQNYPQKGEFLHYIKNYKNIWGTYYFVFLIIGFSLCLYQLLTNFKNFFSNDSFFLEENFLISTSIIVVVLLHTLMNWLPGLHSNLGMLRFMAGIIPLSSIIAIRGLNILNFIPLKTFIKIPLIIILILLTIPSPFKSYFFPFQLNNEQYVIKECANFLNTFNLSNKHICYLHPYLPDLIELDPFDNKKSTLLWSLDKQNLHSLNDSTFIIWDSHFAPQEGNTPLNILLNDTCLVPLKHFKYADTTAPFDAWIFIKKCHSKNVTTLPPNELVTSNGLIKKLVDSLFINFDNYNIKEINNISDKYAFSGKFSYEWTSTNEWGYVFSKKIINKKDINLIDITFKILPKDSLKEVLIITHIVDDNNKTHEWYGYKMSSNLPIQQWKEIHIKKVILNSCNDCNINIYFWNKSKNHFFIDDISIKYLQ